MPRIGSITLALGWVLVAPVLAAGQSPWLGSDRAARVAVELYRPGFDQQDELKSSSYALFLSGKVRASEAVAVVGEVPVAFGGFRSDYDAATQIGNPYVGLEVGRAEQHAWLELGGRLPVVGSDAHSAVAVGLFSDIDRMSAFASEAATISAALNVGTRSSSGLGFRVRAGPELVIPTRSGPDTEKLVYYGAQLSQVRGPLDVSVHAGGVWDVSESGNFGERTVHQAGFGASYAIGGVRPGVTVRLPLDKDMTEVLDYVVGLTLQVPLR